MERSSSSTCLYTWTTPLSVIFAVVVAGGVVACGEDSEPAAPQPDASMDGGGGTGFGPADGATSPPLGPGECPDTNRDVYVISEDRSLYSFNPPERVFKPKGALQCPTGNATPTSMAVDRAGFAWIRYSDDSIWKVSTTTLACERVSLLWEGQGFESFGMGFATESKGGNTEVLYLSDNSGRGLAKLDKTPIVEELTFTINYIGPYTGVLEGRGSELTGTGDGTLHGFFTTTPARIAEISPTTGAIVKEKELPGVSVGSAWAFSFYGGDFYVYTHGEADGTPRKEGGSDVTRYRPSDGTVEVWMPKIAFKIVGAGVSTCAPTAPVR